MSTTELKTGLHKLIDRIEDNSVLTAVYAFLEELSSSDTDLSDEEKKLIDERLDFFEANPDKTESWDVVKDRIQNRKSA